MSKQTNLLKEAIADAKTVRETAIANAKIALEEAFTPRLQSILSKRIQSEMEEEDGEPMDDEMDSMSMEDDGMEAGDDLEDLGEEDDYESSDLDEEDEMDDELSEEDDEEMYSEEDEMDDDFSDEDEGGDDLDLESIIRELEDAMEDDSVEEEEIPGVGFDDPTGADDAEISEEDDYDDSDVDLDEILREMGYGDDEDLEEEEGEDDTAELEAELEEAYSVIKSLKRTINEVNLLNAKLLYTNKLFRSYELTNEQKHKVVETLDRTSNVREVKLVFATLAESLTYGSGVAKKSKKINESFASNVVKSTAPKKQIINEEADLRNRFKELANINKK